MARISPTDVSSKDFYKLLTGTIVPRPIGWISTVNTEGQPNLAPFSFFNAVASRPPTVLFCPLVRGTDGNLKDTVNNILKTEEFVVNIVSVDLLEQMNITATELPAEVNEFEQAGLTTAPSDLVKPPRVAESPVNFECKLHQIVEVGDGGRGSARIVVGEVVMVHIDDRVLQPNYHIDTRALNPAGRLAGPNYGTIGEIIQINRLPSQIEPQE